MAARSTTADARARSSAVSARRSSSGRLGQKIAFHQHLTDLGVRLLDHGLGSSAVLLCGRSARKHRDHARRGLPLPLTHHRLMDAALRRQLRRRQFAPAAPPTPHAPRTLPHTASGCPSLGPPCFQGEPSLTKCPNFGGHLNLLVGAPQAYQDARRKARQSNPHVTMAHFTFVAACLLPSYVRSTPARPRPTHAKLAAQ